MAMLSSYGIREARESDHLHEMQESRAQRRPVDAHLNNPVLEAVEMVGGAATALESCGGWSELEIHRLRAIANLLLHMACQVTDSEVRTVYEAAADALARAPMALP